MSASRISQGLRRKLVGLLWIFAVFAIVTASAAIYGTQWYVRRAGIGFERAMAQTFRADRMHLSLERQILSLRALVEGRHEATRTYFTSRDEFFTLLRQLASFAMGEESSTWSRILHQADELSDASDACLAMLAEERDRDAMEVFTARIEQTLAPELEARIVEAKTELDWKVNQSTRRLAATSSQVISFTVVVGALASLLVVLGAMLIRKWLLVPITTLHHATERFGRGDWSHEVKLTTDDELGALARAMNEMARSVSLAQQHLATSETKHRLLFQNLRDAVILVTGNGEIVEYHDGDSGLLGVEGGGPVGRALLDAWPSWKTASCDWSTHIAMAVADGRRYRATDVELALGIEGGQSRIADILIYRVESGDEKHAAIVLRDVSERVRLQQKLRQAETMEAVGTFAGGLAHDFNNLLAGAIGTLSLLEGEVGNERHAERIRTTIRTCWEASGLSRRLLHFAGSAHGEPQVFCVREATQLIIDSLDPSFYESVDLDADLQASPVIRMDRDQFTQTLLNLLRNARDAMPDGGRLRVELTQESTTRADGDGREQLFALLTVADSGSGMTRDVQTRIFEPFFTTKSRASHRGRGMGMAIVYAAVRNAGGFIQLDTELDVGTTFRVYLPVCEATAVTHAKIQPTVATRTDVGSILLVEQDDVLRLAMATALRGWGYTVFAFEHGDDALYHIVSNTHYALAILDLDLPGEAAMRLAHELRAHESSVIFTTASHVGQPTRDLEEASIGRLVKPFEMDALAASVFAALSCADARP